MAARPTDRQKKKIVGPEKFAPWEVRYGEIS